MREILQNSRRVTRSWNVTLFLFLFLLISSNILRFSKFSSLSNHPKITQQKIITVVVLLLIVLLLWLILLIIETIGAIKLYFLIKDKCYWLSFEEKLGGKFEDNIEKVKILSSLKNILLIIIFFNLFFYLISIFFELQYRREIKKLKNKLSLDDWKRCCI